MTDPMTVRDRRRAEILTEARALVSEGGLDALTISALESRLDFTRGVITYHFHNKAEIVDAVLESAIEEIHHATIAAVEASGSAEAKLRSVLWETTNGFISHVEGGRILLHFWSRLPYDEHAARINARIYQRYREDVLFLIQMGQGAGAFREDVDERALAAVIVGAVIGIVAQVYFEPEAIDWEAAVEEASCSLLLRLTEARPSPKLARLGG